MTALDRKRVKQELDARAREAQKAHDEIEALCDPRVFDAATRELTTEALLGLSIGAEYALAGGERS